MWICCSFLLPLLFLVLIIKVLLEFSGGFKASSYDVPVTTYMGDIVLADIQSTEPFVYKQCRDVYERLVAEQNVTLKSYTTSSWLSCISQQISADVLPCTKRILPS